MRSATHSRLGAGGSKPALDDIGRAGCGRISDRGLAGSAAGGPGQAGFAHQPFDRPRGEALPEPQDAQGEHGGQAAPGQPLRPLCAPVTPRAPRPRGMGGFHATPSSTRPAGLLGRDAVTRR